MSGLEERSGFVDDRLLPSLPRSLLLLLILASGLERCLSFSARLLFLCL